MEVGLSPVRAAVELPSMMVPGGAGEGEDEAKARGTLGDRRCCFTAPSVPSLLLWRGGCSDVG